ncbi:hypothetical protein COCCADRAFT_40104 [Bipolaris zeicola 26-R-13]|uniref:Uncharacterized protein n=1 Tax=Cochliobolus carbonum (strain 26-R-13) TaxID=930089 RepID=W6XUT5_COCC2|nr:uncharacterized protein COCCADRAFT_40104 [Bipolaris zeicola 26-R-13]EUC29518.1 hypothetical protein COCCADRAFT_40104 [Bipolaris zeicola 26-R-13]
MVVIVKRITEAAVRFGNILSSPVISNWSARLSHISNSRASFPIPLVSGSNDGKELSKPYWAISSKIFNYQANSEVNKVPLKNWEQQHGPIKNKDMDFTNRYYIHGHDLLSNNTNQSSAAEDVIIAIDITCSSACGISANPIRKRAGITMAALGGQPQKNTKVLGWTGTFFIIGSVTLYYPAIRSRRPQV